jgi:predicted ATPase
MLEIFRANYSTAEGNQIEKVYYVDGQEEQRFLADERTFANTGSPESVDYKAICDGRPVTLNYRHRLLTSHRKLVLKEFTCFRDQTLEFVGGINVFVGENGTGKTHAMKTMYAVQKAQSALRNTDFQDELRRLFQVDSLDELISYQAPQHAQAMVTGSYGGSEWEFRIQRGQLHGIAKSPPTVPQPELPIFVPAIDMMGHSRGFVSAANIIELDFDSTCFDLLNYLSTKRKATLSDRRELDAKLREVVDDEIVQEEDGRFFLVNDRGRVSMPMVAEGIRKVATLRKLVENNWIARGTTLFWDEPEANLNPKIMNEVVQALLLISRSGVQVFLASHSYLILKELDVMRAHSDSVRFFSFERTEAGTLVHSSDTYLGMRPNVIEEQYAELYDRQIRKEIDALEQDVVQ